MPKKKYNCIFFFENRQPAKYRKVTNIKSLFDFITGSVSTNITSCNIYDSITKEFLCQAKSKSHLNELYKTNQL